MPIYNSSGQAVRGIYGGYRQGQKDERGARQQEGKITEQNLANRSTNAEFFDYMEEEAARTAEYAERKAEAEKDTRNMPSLEAAERAQNEAAEEQAELDEQISKSEKTLVKKKTKLADKALDDGLRKLRKVYNTANIEELVGSAAALKHQLEKGGDPAALYQQAHESLIYSHPEGPQKAAEIYADMGISTQYTPQSLDQMIALGIKADHDLTTRRAEHLMREEWLLRIEAARHNASGKPSDLTHQRASENDKKHLGVRMRGILGKEVFEDLDGSFSEDLNSWTGATGEMVESVADISRSYQSSQKVGIDVNPEEIEFILSDFIRELGGEFIGDESFFAGVGEANSFNGYKFENYSNALLTMLGNTRSAWSSKTGKPVKLTDVWAIRKSYFIEKFSTEE